jgi:hypothetical protein
VESVRDIALKIATGQAFTDEDAIRVAEAWLALVVVPASRSESDEEAA